MNIIAIVISLAIMYAAYAVYRTCRAMEKALQEEQFKMLFKE